MATRSVNRQDETMGIKAIVFDYGSVLNAPTDPVAKARKLRRLAERLNVPEEAFWSYLFEGRPAAEWLTGKISVDEFWKAVLAPRGISDPEELRSFAAEAFAGSYKLNPDMVDLLYQLSSDYKLAVLTNINWTEDAFRALLADDLGLPVNMFAAVVTSYSSGVVKPDPVIYNFVLARLDVKPEEAIFTDDMERFTEAAEEVGMYAHRFSTPREFKEYLKQMRVLDGDLIVEEPPELSVDEEVRLLSVEALGYRDELRSLGDSLLQTEEGPINLVGLAVVIEKLSIGARLLLKDRTQYGRDAEIEKLFNSVESALSETEVQEKRLTEYRSELVEALRLFAGQIGYDIDDMVRGEKEPPAKTLRGHAEALTLMNDGEGLSSEEANEALQIIVDDPNREGGPKPFTTINRIRGAMQERPSGWFFLEELELHFADRVNPRKSAANAISWLNKEFERRGMDIEIASTRFTGYYFRPKSPNS